MRFRVLILAALTVAIGCEPGATDPLGPLTEPTSMSAAVVATTSQLKMLRPPPPSAELNNLESDTHAFWFQERAHVVLAGQVAVDIVDPGTYQANNLPVGLELPAGTPVNSYLVHVEPEQGGGIKVQGKLTFDTDIVGVILVTSALNDSDDELGAVGTTYPKHFNRGTVGRGGSREFKDTVAVSPDRRTLTINVQGDGTADQLRILTAPDPLPTLCGGVATVYFDFNAGLWVATAGATVEATQPGLVRITGTSGDDVIAGTDDAIMVVHAGGGNDRICTGAMADTIFAGAGDDFVHAGGGNDVIEGGSGHDVLVGSTGDDVLIGGPGADSFDGGPGFDKAPDFECDKDIHVGGVEGLPECPVTPPKVTDVTPPVITGSVSGVLGANGWYTSKVTVTWVVEDPESKLFNVQGCDVTQISADTQGATVMCTATSDGGKATETVTVKVDGTAPVIHFSVDGVHYGHDETVKFSCGADDGKAVGQAPIVDVTCPYDGPVPASHFGVGKHEFTAQATDEAGNTAKASVSFKVTDVTPPVIAGSVSGTSGANGWYTSDVQVTWSVRDDESPITSTDGCEATVWGADTGGTTVTCTASSQGGSASASVEFKRDATSPALAYSGNAGVYAVDGAVSIACSAFDATSGIASDSCADIAGDAWSFGVGTHLFSASATDGAGNSGAAQVSFEVTVDAGSLCGLVQRWVSNRGNANSLCQKLQHGSVRAFQNQLRALAGKKVGEEHAAILHALSEEL